MEPRHFGEVQYTCTERDEAPNAVGVEADQHQRPSDNQASDTCSSSSMECIEEG